MKAPLLLTLASLAAAFPLAAQSASAALSGEMDGEDFHDPGISQLVDAAEALRASGPDRFAAPDAGRCTADSLLFCEIHTLSTGENDASLSISAPAEEELVLEDTQAVPEFEPVSTEASTPVVDRPDPETAEVLSTVKAALAEVPPVPAGPVPEPSGILLVIGAAAWILLRRNH